LKSDEKKLLEEYMGGRDISVFKDKLFVKNLLTQLR
jgi:hypothetical protein